jgi:ribonuclease HII
MVRPTLRLERELLRSGARRLGAMDEVGRGSPAGPVYVGLVVVDSSTGRPPTGIRDSKLLAPAARKALAPLIRSWAAGWALGSADPAEVDELGVNGALGLAGVRALGVLDGPPDLLVIDGNHDWLTPAMTPGAGTVPQVVTRVRADQTCTSVAAASILAKVARDALMVRLADEFPAYGWDANKGYGTVDHLDALRRLGPSPHHRISWRLPEQV